MKGVPATTSASPPLRQKFLRNLMFFKSLPMYKVPTLGAPQCLTKSSLNPMVHTRHNNLLAPLLVMTLLTPGLARAEAAVASEPAAMTGQLQQWNSPAPLQPTAVVPRARQVAAPTTGVKVAAIGIDELIAQGPMTIGALVAKAPQEPPLQDEFNQQVPTPQAAALAFSKNQVQEDSTQEMLTISATSAGLVFSPEAIALPTPTAKIKLHLAAGVPQDLQLFVRNQKIADLNAAATELTAHKVGSTELYIVAKGRMYIIPVRVAAPTTGSPNLSVPAALVSLNGVARDGAVNATFAGLEQATATEPASALPAEAELTQLLAGADGFGAAGAAAVSPEVNAASTTDPAATAKAVVDPAMPSLKTSVAETAHSLLQQAADGRRFYNAKEKIGYTTAQVQLIDDRSVPSAGLIYPVAGVWVRVLGTEFMAKTDATGHLAIRDMPRQARFMLRIDDPGGQYRSAIAEMSTADAAAGVTRIRVMRGFAFDSITTIAGSVQQSNRSSYCANVSDKDAEDRLTVTGGVAVSVDATAEGPFYFNQFGFLDRSLSSTGMNGRFCFFNVAPGPMALSLFRGEAWVATLPVSVFANRHVEDDINLSAEASFSTQFASMATAQEQLSNDGSSTSRYQQVDMIDLLPLGADTPLPQVAPGRVAGTEPLISHQGRVRTFARAAEFEPTVYTYQASDAGTVTPLIPRGFIEDMSLYAQVVRDPGLGTVLAEYAAPDGATHETISMRLVDQEGHDVGDGWYFSDAPTTKALFFNVPAGAYSIQVQTKDGYWLSSDTVIVYSETMSYMRLGNRLRVRL